MLLPPYLAGYIGTFGDGVVAGAVAGAVGGTVYSSLTTGFSWQAVGRGASLGGAYAMGWELLE
jgi:hypothetical protein